MRNTPSCAATVGRSFWVPPCSGSALMESRNHRRVMASISTFPVEVRRVFLGKHHFGKLCQICASGLNSSPSLLCLAGSSAEHLQPKALPKAQSHSYSVVTDQGVPPVLLIGNWQVFNFWMIEWCILIVTRQHHVFLFWMLLINIPKIQ